MSQIDNLESLNVDREDVRSSSPETRSQGSDMRLSRSLLEASNETPESREARQGRRIAQLEEKLQTLEHGRSAKEKQTNHFVAQGRALRRAVSLYDNVEDLIQENDRRYREDGSTQDQDRLQLGYIALNVALPRFQKQAEPMEHEDYNHMLKMLRQGADMARGDDTSKLKALVAEWVNIECGADSRVDADDKHHRGFINEACGKLLCPAELDWNDPIVKAGIRNRSDGYIVSDLSFPAFLYEKYVAREDNLEEGLFRGKILIKAYKAVFTSPSSAKDVEGDGDGADISANNRKAQKSSVGIKVKKHIAHIIRMNKVTPRSIAYVACQVCFALSSVTSWRRVDGDFDYVQFWNTIVDFFEKAPGRSAKRRVDKLLEWWTRKVFGACGLANVSSAAKAKMSVNALARQREQDADAEFNSD